MAATVAATAALESGSVLPAPVVTGISNVPLAIPRLVRVEMVECPFPTLRHRPCIAVTRIVPVIDVAVKAVRTVKPGTSPKEHPADEPVRPIVAIRRARIRSIVKISVRAYRRDSNVDGNLSRYDRTAGGEHPSSKDQRAENLDFVHPFTSG
jgi:hypothetical protein